MRCAQVWSRCHRFLVAGLTLGFLGSGSWLFAAGRPPSRGHSEAWLRGEPRGVALFDQGLTSNRECVLQLVRADGSVCRVSTVDALGRQLATDEAGTLVTRPGGASEGTPLAWACLGSGCVESPFSVCHSADNPLDRVVLSCNGQREFALLGPQQIPDPSSAGLTLRLEEAGPIGASIHLIPTLYSGVTAPRSLCTVAVPVRPDDDVATVLGRAAHAINRSSACAMGGVSAEVDRTDVSEMPRLRLAAPDLVGTQLVPAVQVVPGDAARRCFSLQDIGVPELRQTLAMAVRWTTTATGAAGGEVAVVERSPLGVCEVTVPTVAGQDAAALARAIHAAFHRPEIAERCPASQNPKDVLVDGPRILTTLASTLEVCIDDPGVGFTLAAADGTNAPPVADCLDLVVECTQDGQALVTLDASGSSDPDGEPGLTFEWYQNYGVTNPMFLGYGQMLDHLFSLGQHDVTVVVVDASGQSDQASCSVSVVDTTPPLIVGAPSVTPATLFPPNHELVAVNVNLNASDACSPAVVKLASITSSEPDDAPGPGDGATSLDIQDHVLETADFDLRLRAERDRNGRGRTYHVTYEIRDAVWNTTSWAGAVAVPIDVGGVVEPITISVMQEQIPGGVGQTRVSWTDEGSGVAYDVIRGNLRNVMPSGNTTHLGAIECLAVGTSERSVLDYGSVAAGDVAFYLVASADEIQDGGYSTESAERPRTGASCRPVGTVTRIPDPERDSTVPIGWGWLASASEAQVNSHLGQYVERLVDIDRLGPDEYQIVQVRNAGETYGTPAFWWKDQNEAGVIAKIQSVNGRILDLEPFVVGAETRFTVSIIPNEGKRAKAWWWSYDQTQQSVIDAINLNNMRLIDLEVYQKGGQTLYAYVGISNTGIDQKAWWFWFTRTFAEIVSDINEVGARLIDIEALGGGNFAVIMIENDGSHWWWGAGYTVEQIGAVVDSKASRLVDLERYMEGGQWRYAFISLDNVNTAEGRRLRSILDQSYDDPQFGGPVIRGALVKESNGPIIADIAGGLRFQPASTLKLLPYLYAVQEVDRGNASLGGSTVSWIGNPGDPYASCLTMGTPGSATFTHALPTMMWYSHNRTLDAFFGLYPPYHTNPQVETLTSRAQSEWGLANTEMYFGCPGNTPSWLSNRSTLYEIGRIYEGAESLAFFNQSSSRNLFWNNMINQMQGDCLNNSVGTGSCTCPSYYPQCPGNYYISPYLGGDSVGPIGAGFLTSVVQQEGGASFPVAAFMDEVLMRGKGGGASVPDFPYAGFWDGYRSNSLHVTLPFKNGLGNIVPRTFIVTWFVNGWDGSCGTGLSSPACDAAIATADMQTFSTLPMELLRVPVRQAVGTW